MLNGVWVVVIVSFRVFRVIRLLAHYLHAESEESQKSAPNTFHFSMALMASPTIEKMIMARTTTRANFRVMANSSGLI